MDIMMWFAKDVFKLLVLLKINLKGAWDDSKDNLNVKTRTEHAQLNIQYITIINRYR